MNGWILFILAFAIVFIITVGAPRALVDQPRDVMVVGGIERRLDPGAGNRWGWGFPYIHPDPMLLFIAGSGGGAINNFTFRIGE